MDNLRHIVIAGIELRAVRLVNEDDVSAARGYRYTHAFVGTDVRPSSSVLDEFFVVDAPHLMLRNFTFRGGVWIRTSVLWKTVEVRSCTPLDKSEPILASGADEVREGEGTVPPTWIDDSTTKGLPTSQRVLEMMRILQQPAFVREYFRGIRTILLTRRYMVEEMIASPREEDTGSAASQDAVDASNESGSSGISQNISCLRSRRNAIDAQLRKCTSPDGIKMDLIKACTLLSDISGADEVVGEIIRLIAAVRFPQYFFTFFTNIALLGRAGSGKTFLAAKIARVLETAGLALSPPSGTPQIATRASLVAGFLGQTAGRTKDFLEAHIGGVMVIDEVYQLANLHAHDYGHEAISEIVNFLDKYIGCSTMIVCGYAHETRSRFFASNEGLARRFPVVVELRQHSSATLAQIFASKIMGVVGTARAVSAQRSFASVVEDAMASGNNDINPGDVMTVATDVCARWCTSIAHEHAPGEQVSDVDFLSGVRIIAKRIIFEVLARKQISGEVNDEDQSSDNGGYAAGSRM